MIYGDRISWPTSCGWIGSEQFERFIIHSYFEPIGTDGKFRSVYIISLKNKQKSTNSNILLRNKTLFLSVSFKSAYIHFALVIDMLSLLQFSYAIVKVRFKTLSNILNFLECFLLSIFFGRVSPFYLSPSIYCLIFG